MKKTKQTLDIVAAFVANVKTDRQVTCMDLATAHGVSYGTMHNILHEELELVKKTARWMDLHVFVAPVNCHSMLMLDNIVMMDESMVSYHMPQTKRQSKQ